MKTLRKYIIVAMLLTAVVCSPAIAEQSCPQSDSVKSDIKKSFVVIGQATKKAGRIIGQNFKKLGKQTGQALKDTAKALKNSAREDSKK